MKSIKIVLFLFACFCSFTASAQAKQNWVLLFVLTDFDGRIATGQSTINFENEKSCMKWYEERKHEFSPAPSGACVQVHAAMGNNKEKWIATYLFTSMNGFTAVGQVDRFESSLSCNEFLADVKELRSETVGSCDRKEDLLTASR